jgi:type VI secretion system FHA domain protein
MKLVLSVLRCPDAIPPESRTLTGGEFTAGRGPGVDWILPDPERLLSKRHFALAYRGAAWQVADISTNGTFLNREDAPIGKDAVRALRDGDRIRLGAYEIEVRLIEEAAQRGGPPEDRQAGRRASASDQGRSQDSGFPLDDPFASPGAPFEATPDAFSASPLPDDFDPLGPDPARFDFRGPTQDDHAPALSDALASPKPAGALLPQDWADSFLDGIGEPEEPPAVPPARPAPPLVPPVVAAPSAIPEAQPAPPPAAAPVSAATAADADLLTAFLEGTGMADIRPGDPVATMRGLGAAFRALVVGLRAALIARASVKSEFRIEQTIIRARGNNPLKFAAGDDDALAALLGAGRRTDMPAEQAVADALKDIRLHELASMAAMQAAIRTLLDGLDPARLAAGQSGGLLPAQRKARAWDAYEELHARTVRALADDFDSIFGKAFARAYEHALADISARNEA